MEKLIDDATIGEIVAQDFRTAAVFNAHGMDFCCGGNRQLRDVCSKMKVDVNVVLNELATVMATPGQEDNFNDGDLNRLIDHILTKHHSYVRTSIPVLQEFLEKLCRVHGSNHPELFEVHALFQEGSANLLGHMQKEENILFPMVRSMMNGGTDAGTSAHGKFSVRMPIQVMEQEHEMEGDRFTLIARITEGFTYPEDACTTYRVTYAMLRDFETDLHKHIHLENNILFPMAIEMECEVK